MQISFAGQDEKDYKFKIWNDSGRAVTGFTIRLIPKGTKHVKNRYFCGSECGTSTKVGTNTKPILKVHEGTDFSCKVSDVAGGAIVIEAAIFDDESYEGGERAAASLVASQMGGQAEYDRIVFTVNTILSYPLADSAKIDEMVSEIPGLSTDADAATLNSFKAWFPNLPDCNQRYSKAMNESASAVKGAMLDRLGQFRPDSSRMALVPWWQTTQDFLQQYGCDQCSAAEAEPRPPTSPQPALKPCNAAAVPTPEQEVVVIAVGFLVAGDGIPSDDTTEDTGSENSNAKAASSQTVGAAEPTPTATPSPAPTVVPTATPSSDLPATAIQTPTPAPAPWALPMVTVSPSSTNDNAAAIGSGDPDARAQQAVRFVPEKTFTIGVIAFDLKGSFGKGLITAEIYSEFKGLPGTLLYRVTAAAPAPTSGGHFTIATRDPFVMQAGTPYWLTATNGSPDSGNWWWYSDQIGWRAKHDLAGRPSGGFPRWGYANDGGVAAPGTKQSTLLAFEIRGTVPKKSSSIARVESKAPSILFSVDRKDPVDGLYRISLWNMSTHGVSEYCLGDFTGGPARTLNGHSRIHPIIASGEAFQIAASRVLVQSVLFNDGSYEGDSDCAGKMAASQTGRHIQEESIRSTFDAILARSDANDVAKENLLRLAFAKLPEDSDEAMLRRFKKDFPGITMNYAAAHDGIGLGLKDAKTEILLQLNAFETTYRFRRTLVEWWAKTKPSFE